MNPPSGQVTPGRGFSPGYSPSLVEQSLVIHENQRKLKKCLYRGAVNMCLLAIILYDIMNTCPLYISLILYLEYALCTIFIFNILYHFFRYITVSLYAAHILITPRQKQLLGVKDFDPNYTILSDRPLFSPASPTDQTTPNLTFSSTPMNTSAVSWRSNMSSFNDSPSYYNSSLSYAQSSPKFSPNGRQRSPLNGSPQLNPTRHDRSGGEFIDNEQSLTEYLKGYQIYEKTANISSPIEQSTSLLSSFWNHPAAKNAGDVTSFLRRCQYQLSTVASASTSNSPSGKVDGKGSPINQPLGMDMWRRLRVDSITLTQWNANIRKWISQTIVERLVKEIEYVDDALQKQVLSDVRIGGVGLDRLRKTAQMTPVLQFIPTLSALLPFLEVSANQEYLVQRIRELAKGGCMSDFKWNGGSSFGGKEWNDSLPTDSAIIMHLFTTYMDTQLLPSPNQPDIKPFSGYHYIKWNDKLPQLSSTTLAIHQVSEKPPHYRVIIGEEIFEMVKGYNNLFHSLLLFLYQVNKKEHGMLGRINLGRSGVNVLWVINS